MPCRRRSSRSLNQLHGLLPPKCVTNRTQFALRRLSGLLGPSVPINRIGRDFVAPDDLAMLHRMFKNPVRILNLHQPSLDIERIPDDVQPVSVAELLRLGPLAVFELDRVPLGVTFDLDAPDFHCAERCIESSLCSVVEA